MDLYWYIYAYFWYVNNFSYQYKNMEIFCRKSPYTWHLFKKRIIIKVARIQLKFTTWHSLADRYQSTTAYVCCSPMASRYFRQKKIFVFGNRISLIDALLLIYCLLQEVIQTREHPKYFEYYFILTSFLI